MMMMMSQTCADACVVRDSLSLPGCRKEEGEEESPITESGSDDDDDDEEEEGEINSSSVSVIRYFSAALESLFSQLSHSLPSDLESWNPLNTLSVSHTDDVRGNDVLHCSHLL